MVWGVRKEGDGKGKGRDKRDDRGMDGEREMLQCYSHS